MRSILLYVFIAFFSIASAQLSVRNDAYIFVKDQIVFVGDDINLNETNSKIYLRNEGQLIQGNGVTGNSGLGELSVYQQGNVNVWSYNYWCSPIGGIFLNNFINNPFRVNQTDDPLLGTADPIDSANSGFTGDPNGSSNPLIISNRWLYTFVSSSTYSGWTRVGDNKDIATGLGYSMKGIGTGTTGNQTYDFRGKPNNGTIINPVAANQNTLIGNPYPSAIDAAAFIHDSDNVNAIESTLYFWEQDGTVNSHFLQDYVGGYYEFTINPAGDMITDSPAVFMTYDEQDNEYPLTVPAEGVKFSRRYIPIGQGFMVEGISGTTGTVFMKNEFRAYEKEGANSVFFRNANQSEEIDQNSSIIQYQENGLSIVPEDYKRFRINVDFTVNTSQYTRQVVLNFHDGATIAYDRGLELKRSSSYESDAYFKLDESDYSGLALPYEESLVIPLHVNIEQQQPLRFRIFDIQNFDESQPIYLYDKEDNLYINLRDQDYELNIEAGNYNSRFEVVFTSQEVLNIEELAVETLTINQNNSEKQLVILNPDNLNIESIEIFDVTGKLISNTKHSDAKDRYEIATSSFSNGVYVVNVVSNKAINKTKKIIIKN